MKSASKIVKFVILCVILYLIYDIFFGVDYKDFVNRIIDERIAGKVIKFKNERSVSNIWLMNGDKHELPYSINSNYQNEKLYEFIQIGDSIYKKEREDSLFIFREGNKYLFRINKHIKKNSEVEEISS